jgi:hypothetical protein
MEKGLRPGGKRMQSRESMRGVCRREGLEKEREGMQGNARKGVHLGGKQEGKAASGKLGGV